MINYTERITLLMQDVVRAYAALSFIDLEGSGRVRAASGGPTPRERSRPAIA